jgi:hypothetical protein
MALPLIPIIAALAAGGSLVPHAAGGFIVSSAVSSYVAGTYISTAALAAYLTSTGVITCVGLAGLFGSSIGGAAMALIGGAGIAGTTVGATGLTGVLMSWGVISSVPIVVPVIIVLFIPLLMVVGIYPAWRFRKLNGKIQSAEKGVEIYFSQSEALLLERVLVGVSRIPFWLKRSFVKFFKKGTK